MPPFPTIYDLAEREGVTRAEVDAGFPLLEFLAARPIRR
jgi:hypothetical protein